METCQQQKEETDCWGEQQKSSAAMWVKIQVYLERSTRRGRAVKTPGHHVQLPAPYCYLQPLSTASLSAKASRFIFKAHSVSHMDGNTLPWNGIHSTCFLKRSKKYLWLQSFVTVHNLTYYNSALCTGWTTHYLDSKSGRANSSIFCNWKKSIIRKETVPLSFQKPEQGLKVLTENDQSV